MTGFSILSMISFSSDQTLYFTIHDVFLKIILASKKKNTFFALSEIIYSENTYFIKADRGKTKTNLL